MRKLKELSYKNFYKLETLYRNTLKIDGLEIFIAYIYKIIITVIPHS